MEYKDLEKTMLRYDINENQQDAELNNEKAENDEENTLKVIEIIPETSFLENMDSQPKDINLSDHIEPAETASEVNDLDDKIGETLQDYAEWPTAVANKTNSIGAEVCSF